MNLRIGIVWAAALVAACITAHASGAPAGAPFLLGPPPSDGPVVVRVSFEMHGINAIDDEGEVFEFVGVFTTRWQDPRQAFDPVAEGVAEKVFQGDYQVNELSPGWFPQWVLENETGLFEKRGVVLRVRPDGSSTLIETLNAAAKTEFNMLRFPFDRQRLLAVFKVVGFDQDEVELRVEPQEANIAGGGVAVPQWTITSVGLTVGERPAPHAGAGGAASTLVLGVEIQREPFFMIRLVVLPLILIVLLSFSVFWMDRSSLGDRISVSFIGILTGVAYQIVTSDNLPHISYFTLMHAFLNLSFLTMCATVVINLRVGALDKQGKQKLGDLIDRRCRRIFPAVYFGLVLVILTAALLLL